MSGSTDHTIRVWDVGQQRCISTLAVHEDSVWALAMDTAFGTVTSGGRDGCIYRCVCRRCTWEVLAAWGNTDTWKRVTQFTYHQLNHSGVSRYRTNISQRTSELVARDLGPVQRLAMSSEGQLWSVSEGVGLAAWPPLGFGSASPAGRSELLHAAVITGAHCTDIWSTGQLRSTYG